MITAIIVAAGKGTRMKGDLPKQYVMLGDRPILAHTISVFEKCDIVDSILLIIPDNDIDYCTDNILTLAEKPERIKLIAGGKERQESVYNGLLAASGSKVVLIHDGVRPFITNGQIQSCVDSVEETGACILAVPVTDTIKQVDSSGYINATMPRDTLWQAQTPQAFRYNLILDAHEKALEDAIPGTDDAQLVERLGKKVKIITGSRKNIKITTLEDMAVARAILEN
ncbi:MAG: 2-C-methyl-D-erythritol 4-phosphate cytidylyltransferase [Desulfobacterales bacterium]|nr:2-C-methyl-D-erythritol 4-phosphate cytidylyltransferase [Desulfobacterales bacterium]